MRFLFWIVAIALLFIAGFFAVANREVVEIDLWPVFAKVAMPLYLGLSSRCPRLHPRRRRRVVGRTHRRARAARRRGGPKRWRASVTPCGPSSTAARPKPPALDLAARPASPAPLPAVWPTH